ncbi:MAG: histidine kinase [Rhodobiaceae bacterium]|nr:histidine kinase [Rhodobiaceae bacterium]|tara:strand:- start:26250 stop:27884 length:1635 start_codon:yes stop_codon:yes gene_type:complete
MKIFNISRKIPISLSKRIIILNLIALLMLVFGILYLNQFRQGLIDAKIEALKTQSQIISNTISTSATSSKRTNLFLLDPNIDNGLGFDQRIIQYRNYTINKKLLEDIIIKLIIPEKIRAQVYDSNNKLMHDSNEFFLRKNIKKNNLQLSNENNFFTNIYLNTLNKLDINNLNRLKYSTNFNLLSDALNGSNNIVVSENEKNQAVVSIAVPIKKYKAIIGYLVLSTQDNAIDMIVNQERASILKVFIVAAFITILLSLVLSYTIGKPVKELADAADVVRNNLNRRHKIPDFSDRKDEIGNLSRSLNDMTASLYNRIDIIEKFSADVAHELRNPLTSLKSAVEAFPVIKKKSERIKLIEIINEDIDRIDRLISDISETSKLDTALTIEKREIVDLLEILSELINLQNFGGVTNKIFLKVESAGVKFYSKINKDRINQVFINLFDNARSFSTNGEEIAVAIRSDTSSIYITVSDSFGGIKGTKIDRIFDRFYTDRPVITGNNKHSGLGLSIAKQIIESHDGLISVKNNFKYSKKGATFEIKLPKYRV